MRPGRRGQQDPGRGTVLAVRAKMEHPLLNLANAVLFSGSLVLQRLFSRNGP